MQLGFIGLGRMGANMVRRLMRDGHEIVVYNRTPEKTKEIVGEGAVGACTSGAPIETTSCGSFAASVGMLPRARHA